MTLNASRSNSSSSSKKRFAGAERLPGLVSAAMFCGMGAILKLSGSGEKGVMIGRSVGLGATW